MPSRKPRRTVSRIVKIASLGVVGLIAGMLSGCHSTSHVLSYNHDHNADATWQANLTYSPAPMPLRPGPLNVQPNPALERHYLYPKLHEHDRSPHIRLVAAR